jgi:hypothetical protein
LQEFKEPVRLNRKDRIGKRFVTGVPRSAASLARPKGVATPDKLHLRAQNALRTYDNGSPLFTTASQARQRSTGGDPFGLASEATLRGWRPLRPRKRGNAPRVATPSASQARQRSTGGDPFGLASEAALHGWRPLRPRKRGSAPGVPSAYLLFAKRTFATSVRIQSFGK